MPLITIPGTLSAQNSVSSDHIINVYESLTSGSIDVNLNKIYLKNISATNCEVERINLSHCNDVISFKSNPYSNLNTIMEAYGMSANSANEGSLCIAKWFYNNVYYTILTACMKSSNGSSYEWVYNSNLIRWYGK